MSKFYYLKLILRSLYGVRMLPGQGWILQFSVMLFEPMHSFPPNSATIFGTLELVRAPIPHSLEHFPISHSSHWQSTKKY